MMLDTFRYDDYRLVEFGFVINIGNDTHEVKGEKTLKLFRSWFRLACNWQYKYTPKNQRRKVLYGYVKFLDNNETWIWQNKELVYHGGWKLFSRATE